MLITRQMCFALGDGQQKRLELRKRFVKKKIL